MTQLELGFWILVGVIVALLADLAIGALMRRRR